MGMGVSAESQNIQDRGAVVHMPLSRIAEGDNSNEAFSLARRPAMIRKSWEIAGRREGLRDCWMGELTGWIPCLWEPSKGSDNSAVF